MTPPDDIDHSEENVVKFGRTDFLKKFDPKKFSKKTWIIAGTAILLIILSLVVGLVFYLLSDKSLRPPSSSVASSDQSADTTNPNNQSGQSTKYYSFTSACQGTGRKALTTLPINLDVIRSIWPLGRTGGEDVIPYETDSFFFKNLDTPSNSYTVVSPASGVIAMVNEHHSFAPAGGSSGTRYEVMIAHTCTQYSFIFDLSSVDSSAVAGQQIAEGQVVGKVGGSHGFAYGILDTSSPNHYVIPEHYDAYKLYGKNAFDYFSDNLKATLEVKSLRRVPPRGGVLGIDQDGKLVGNWHKQGSEGFSNQPGQEDYYKNFLAFGYDFIDVGHLRFSIGNYLGQPKQFGVKGNGPDPANVSVSSGIIKYELVDYHYKNETTGQVGENTDSFDPANVYKPVNDDPVIAVLLVQLTADRTLKQEFFPGKNATQVSGFTDKATMYER